MGKVNESNHATARRANKLAHDFQPKVAIDGLRQIWIFYRRASLKFELHDWELFCSSTAVKMNDS